MAREVWLFGYGSLIWRPGFDYRARRTARVRGWVRRFWQGSHDHRGLPHAPGRVVTLIPDRGGACEGAAYLMEEGALEATFARLDHREKNGYERHDVELELRDGGVNPGLVYIAPRGNHAYLGPAPFADMVDQIQRSAGPSGSNLDYLHQLAGALRELAIDDPHVFELEAAVADRLRIVGDIR